MSLVNNMLRDLDQRRKEGEGSGASVRLTPASEFPKIAQTRWLPFFFGMLVLAAIALGYYWIQLDRSPSEQQLDIRIAQPALSAEPESESEESIESTIQPEFVVAESSISTNENSSSVPVPSQPLEVPLVNNAGVNRDQVPAEAATVQSSAIEVTESQIPLSSNDRIVAVDESQIETTSNLNEAANNESMKNQEVLSNEQKDTIAVQEALQLISDGKTDLAYIRLEQHIASNQYANQSREFYAQLLMSRGDTKTANELVDTGLNIAPNHHGFKKVKARLLIAEGNMEDAVNILISRAPDVTVDSEYHDIMAGLQLVIRDYAGAAISYRGLVRLDQTQGKWWYGYAAALDNLGNRSDARQAYTQAMKYSNLSANLRRRSQERLGELGR